MCACACVDSGRSDDFVIIAIPANGSIAKWQRRQCGNGGQLPTFTHGPERRANANNERIGVPLATFFDGNGHSCVGKRE